MARRRVRIESTSVGRRYLPVAEELLDLYAPRVGWQGVAAWLVLRLAADRGDAVGDEDPASFVARRLGMTPLEAAEALRRLTLYRLVEETADHAVRVLEPLSAAEFAKAFGEGPSPEPAQETAAGEAEPAATSERGGAEPSGAMPTDLRGVLEWYHRRIGLISDSQAERLQEWITQRGMTTDVVALAIEQAARSAEYASFSYLEGILRNWYNQGVRTWADVLRRPHLATVLGASRPAERSDAPMTGVPNADAYRPVDPERVRRIKELYGHGG